MIRTWHALGNVGTSLAESDEFIFPLSETDELVLPFACNIHKILIK